MEFSRWRSIFLFMLLGLTGSCKDPDETGPAPIPRVLIFYKTAGFYHPSIPEGIKAIFLLGQQHQFLVDSTRVAGNLTAEKLKSYRAVIFLNTTQDVLNAGQQAAFENFIRSGRGFVGVHAATDTEYNWPWYHQLVGAYFAGHPAIQKANIQVTDKNHTATNFLPDIWERTDEWYNFRDLVPGLKILATLDESTYTGGTHGPNHPIAWYREFDGGRAFYTAGGHTEQSYSEPLFLKHLAGGILYAIGK